MKYYLLIGAFIFTYTSFLLWVTQTAVLSDYTTKPTTSTPHKTPAPIQQILGVANEIAASPSSQIAAESAYSLKKGSFNMPLSRKDYQVQFVTSYYQTFDPVVKDLLQGEASDSGSLAAQLIGIQTVLDYPKLFQPQTRQLAEKNAIAIIKKVLEKIENEEQSPLWYAVTADSLKKLQKKGYTLEASKLKILKEILAFFSESKDLREQVMGGFGIGLFDTSKKFPDNLSINSSNDTDILSVAVLGSSQLKEASHSAQWKDALHNKALLKDTYVVWPNNDDDVSDLVPTALAIKAITVSEGNLDLAKKASNYLESIRQVRWEGPFTSALVVQSLAGLSEKLYDTKPNFLLEVKNNEEQVYSTTIKNLNTRIPTVSLPKSKIASEGAILTVKQEGVGDLYTIIE